MKKLSILLACVLVALAACTKSKEVHPEIGDGNDEIVTVGMKDVHVEYTRTDHAELQKVVFHYNLTEAQQFVAAEMTKRETFFELTLNDLLSDTLYSYYYELFPNNGDAFNTSQKTFRTQAFDAPEPPIPPSGEHDYVDLGLPSGLLWATCNVGANAPEERGDYFAWGETETHTNIGYDYIWTNYKYCNGYYDQLTKYCNIPSCGYNGFTDNLTILQPDDDAANVNWGGDWRTPDINEWNELFSYCTQTWTIQNGKNGRLFTSPNGNVLFLPAAGFRNEDFCFYNSTGSYWSSTLYPDTPISARTFIFDSELHKKGGHPRAMGSTVRPVRSTR